MGVMACSCQRLQSRRPVTGARGFTERLPVGLRTVTSRRSYFRSIPEKSHGEIGTQDGSINGAASIFLQASLFAVALAVPFAAADNAWAGRKAPKEEPVVTVVEDPEPEIIQKARALAKQAEEQATKAVQTAQATSAAAVEYVREQSVVVAGRAQDLKQQLVATYGNPAALEKTEVKVAGAVVGLVVFVVLFKAVSSIFSSPAATEAAQVESKAVDTNTPPAPPASVPQAPAATPVAERPVGVAVPAPVAAVTAAAAPVQSSLDPESAAALAADLRDLYENNPQQFAVMAQWLQSSAAESVRPRLLDELQRLASLATSSQDEDDLPPPPAPSNGVVPAAPAAPSSNGVVQRKKTKAEKEVDARQLVTMVEWLRSPGAAPVRDKLGADVADQVAVWASRRVGLPEAPSSLVEPVASAPEPAQTAAEADPQPETAAPDARQWIDNWAAKQSTSEAGAAPAAQTDARQWIDNWAAKQAQGSTSTEPVADTAPAESAPAPVAEAATRATPAAVSEPPSEPASLGDVIKKKGAATPALIALGLGALALDLVVGKSPSKKSRKAKTTPGTDNTEVKAESRPDAATGSIQPAVIQQVAVTPTAVENVVATTSSAVELETVTFR